MPETYLHGVKRRALHLSALLAVVLVTAPAPSETTAEQKKTGPFHRWTSIRLKVKSMPLLSGRVWMHRTAGEKKTELRTETIARFFGMKVSSSHTRTVMRAASGVPESFVSWNAKRGRRFTFGDKDILVERVHPGDDGPERPVESWPATRGERFPYPTDADGKRLPVFDYYSMLLQLQRTTLAEVGDEVVLHVATSKGPEPFVIRVAELRAAELEYRELPEDVERKTVVREMRLTILPADPEGEEGFMNMRGETELWVEEGSKTVLRIGGKAPKVGKITLVLAEVG